MRHIAPFISLTLAAGAILAVAYGYLAMTTPARAQSTPPGSCKTMADIETEVEAIGGIISGAASYHGSQTDSLLVVETADIILLYGFKEGCYVGAMAVEAAKPETNA